LIIIGKFDNIWTIDQVSFFIISHFNSES